MAIRPILTREQPVLRRKAHKVSSFDASLDRLVQDMWETMYDAPGVGLAAPQIGVPLRVLVADVLVSLAGHVSVKVFLGEYWTGATSDFQSVRNRIWTLASLGYFGPPVGEPSLMMQRDMKDSFVDEFWKHSEESVERLLIQHRAEVEALTQALLKRGDLSGKECLEIMSEVTNSNGKIPEPEELLPGPQPQEPAGDQDGFQVS